MIYEVKDRKRLKQFIYYVKELYGNNELYVYPIFKTLFKELKQEILISNRYTGLLAYRDKKIVGRILFTYEFNNKKNMNVCYFSFFDQINDAKVTEELFAYIFNDMKKNNVTYIEGTFSPYDPDTRRGVLVEGFNQSPTLFCSYNYEYYNDLLCKMGFIKALDTVELNVDLNKFVYSKLIRLGNLVKNRYDVRVDNMNYRNLEKDINDVHEILQSATTEINYQEAPSIELIRSVAKSMKLFINPELIKIARENKTNKPIGFCLILPDFNEVIKKTKGRFRPIKYLLLRKKIERVKGTLQYIIPEYQNTGLLGIIYLSVYETMQKYHINYFSAGTIVEYNHKSIDALLHFGAEISKRYRLYGKEI